MLMTRVIPCLLLKGTGLVKTVRFADEVYVGDAINAVRIFNEKEIDELIFLDILATVEDRPVNEDFLRDIAGECFMPLCYGGGVHSLEQMERIFGAGVEKVAINAAAVNDPGLIEQAARRFGSQSIVVAIDVRRSWRGRAQIYTQRGSRKHGLTPLQHARQAQECGAGEIFLNSIDADGTGSGYDLELLGEVASAVSVPVIACGGAGELEHFRDAVDAGASAVAAGSMFVFHGKHRAVLITYPEVHELEELFAIDAGCRR